MWRKISTNVNKCHQILTVTKLRFSCCHFKNLILYNTAFSPSESAYYASPIRPSHCANQHQSKPLVVSVTLIPAQVGTHEWYPTQLRSCAVRKFRCFPLSRGCGLLGVASAIPRTPNIQTAGAQPTASRCVDFSRGASVHQRETPASFSNSCFDDARINTYTDWQLPRDGCRFACLSPRRDRQTVAMELETVCNGRKLAAQKQNKTQTDNDIGRGRPSTHAHPYQLSPFWPFRIEITSRSGCLKSHIICVKFAIPASILFVLSCGNTCAQTI